MGEKGLRSVLPDDTQFAHAPEGTAGASCSPSYTVIHMRSFSAWSLHFFFTSPGLVDP